MADTASDPVVGISLAEIIVTHELSVWKWNPPDTTPPHLGTRTPAPGDVGVDREAVITLEVLDDGVGLSLSTVLVEIDDGTGSGYVVAYSGSTDTFSAPYNGPLSIRTAIAGGQRISIDRTTTYNPNTIVSIRVTAADGRGNAL
jgi:hypothetical protein